MRYCNKLNKLLTILLDKKYFLVLLFTTQQIHTDNNMENAIVPPCAQTPAGDVIKEGAKRC